MANKLRAKLLIRAGPIETEYLLPDGVVAIGRLSENDVIVPDRTVSRQHARITPQEGRWLLEDLKSANGTRVDGKQVTRHELSPGEVVQVGSAQMTFRVLSVEESAAMPASAKRRRVRVGSGPGALTAAALGSVGRLVFVSTAAVLVIFSAVGGFLYFYQSQGGWAGIRARLFASRVAEGGADAPGLRAGHTAKLGRSGNPRGALVLDDAAPRILSEDPAHQSLAASSPVIALARRQMREADQLYKAYWGIPDPPGPRGATPTPTVQAKPSHLYEAKVRWERAAETLGRLSPRPFDYGVARGKADRATRELRAVVREKQERAERHLAARDPSRAREELLSILATVPDPADPLHVWAEQRYRAVGG